MQMFERGSDPFLIHRPHHRVDRATLTEREVPDHGRR
jgi:hypothetical protein